MQIHQDSTKHIGVCAWYFYGEIPNLPGEQKFGTPGRSLCIEYTLMY